MLATICAVILATQELVCSAPIQAQLADILSDGNGIHLFASGGEMFDTNSQPTGHLFTIYENDAMWGKALRASAPKTRT